MGTVSLSSLTSTYCTTQFGKEVAMRYDLTSTPDSGNTEGFAVRFIIEDVVKNLDLTCDGLRSIDKYTDLIHLLEPHIMRKLGLALNHKIPLPAIQSTVSYCHFLFGLLSGVRFGMVDGQHRSLAFLCLLTGYRPFSQVPACFGEPSHIVWYRRPDFVAADGLYNSDSSLLNAILSHHTLNLTLMVPKVSHFSGSFLELYNECQKRSKMKDKAGMKKAPSNLTSVWYKKVMDKAICRAQMETGPVRSFGARLLCNLSHSEIVISEEGLISVVPLYEKALKSPLLMPGDLPVEDGAMWISQDVDYFRTFCNLSQYEIITNRYDVSVAFEDVPNPVTDEFLAKLHGKTLHAGGLVPNPKSKSYSVSTADEMYRRWKTKYDKINVTDVPPWQESNVACLLKYIPPYIEDVPLERWRDWKVWKICNEFRVQKVVYQKTLSTPGFLSLHHTFATLIDIIDAEEHREKLMHWVLDKCFSLAGKNSVWHKYARKYFTSRNVTDNEKFRSLHSMWFFPTATKRWQGLFLERFNHEVDKIFPMLLPPPILGFGRIVGFLSHSVSSLKQFRDLLQNPLGCSWDVASDSVTLQVCDDVKVSTFVWHSTNPTVQWSSGLLVWLMIDLA